MGAEHSRRSHARRNQQTTSASVPVTSHGALALVQGKDLIKKTKQKTNSTTTDCQMFFFCSACSNSFCMLLRFARLDRKECQ